MILCSHRNIFSNFFFRSSSHITFCCCWEWYELCVNMSRNEKVKYLRISFIFICKLCIPMHMCQRCRRRWNWREKNCSAIVVKMKKSRMTVMCTYFHSFQFYALRYATLRIFISSLIYCSVSSIVYYIAQGFVSLFLSLGIVRMNIHNYVYVPLFLCTLCV